MRSRLALSIAIAIGLFTIVGLENTSKSAERNLKSKSVSVEWSVSQTGKPLEREAVITLKDGDGKPVSDAKVEVLVDMPSMPMMHQVPKAIAEPTSEPGNYRTRFTLEMPGEWAAQIEVKEPVRLKVIRKFTAD